MNGRTIHSVVVFGFIAIILTGVSIWLGYLTAFVDERWAGFTVVSAFATFVSWSIVGVCAMVDVSFTLPQRKPKGWRRLRREAEERAYIKKLEEELGL